MGVIADLERKLKTAQRIKARATKEWTAATAESGARRRALDEAEAHVSEIEEAIDVLKRGLKPGPVLPSTVTRLRR